MSTKLGCALLAFGCLTVAGAEARSHDRPLVENFQKADAPTGNGPKVLFDNTHAQTAGNADWTIVGAYSSFADTLRHHGYQVSSNDRGEIDASKLAGVKVLVVPEPNTRFTKGELDAITAFVKAGGGLFAISDHAGADRNGDGWDPVMIWNELTPAWGIKFSADKHNEDPLTGAVAASPIAANVTKIGCWAGCSLELSGPAQPAFNFSKQNGGAPFVATTTVGSGRVVAIGDSSPFDDGSGDPHDHLYPTFDSKKWDIPQFSLNAVNWLAGKQGEKVDK